MSEHAPKQNKPRILYIAYWGAAEPLGQSLVLPAVKQLAELGGDLTLVTFEKPNDLSRHEEISRIRATLVEQGIRWLGLRYHKTPKIPATLFDFVQGCLRSIIASLRNRPDVIHARTFIGGLIGITVAWILRSKLIYHNEGFYPDEQVDAGVWKIDSPHYKIAKALENFLYSHADGVIALSHKGKSKIESLPQLRQKQTPTIVVPSCVDLDHFKSNRPGEVEPDSRLRMVYVGSVGGRYYFDRVVRFAFIASQLREVHLRVLTQTDHKTVLPILEASGLPDGYWSVDSVPYQSMPDELANQHVGIHFLSQGLADFGGSPTKIGEYWAAGLPAVVTSNAGDTDDIIRREGVGVIVENHSDEEYRRVSMELLKLLEDPNLAFRCRRAAETNYALSSACNDQFRLYEMLTSKQASSPVTVRA
jgi:glycosyltransferase involved in cell wall biosynthesis